MKKHIIVIRDIVADVHWDPRFVSHLGHAIREFGDACLDPKKDNVLSQHPEDFELWHIGEYDDEHASFEVENSDNLFDRKQIAVGSNYRHRKEEQK